MDRFVPYSDKVIGSPEIDYENSLLASCGFRVYEPLSAESGDSSEVEPEIPHYVQTLGGLSIDAAPLDVL